MCIIWRPVLDDVGDLVGHYDQFGNFFPAGGVLPGGCP